MYVLEMLVSVIDFLKIIAENCCSALNNMAKHIPITSSELKVVKSKEF
jgi:hypothetical protein